MIFMSCFDAYLELWGLASVGVSFFTFRSFFSSKLASNFIHKSQKKILKIHPRQRSQTRFKILKAN